MSGWENLRQFLDTDPRDVGCAEATAVLHVYVELVLAGVDPDEALPGVAVHLRSCGPCGDDYEGLLTAARRAGGDA